jgi:hypothetical protein
MLRGVRALGPRARIGALSLSPGAPAKTGRRRIALLTLLAALALLLVRVAVWQPLAVFGEATSDGYVRVPGVVHIHTTLSDGSERSALRGTVQVNDPDCATIAEACPHMTASPPDRASVTVSNGSPLLVQR